MTIENRCSVGEATSVFGQRSDRTKDMVNIVVNIYEALNGNRGIKRKIQYDVNLNQSGAKKSRIGSQNLCVRNCRGQLIEISISRRN